jgi:hypothetical protein
VVDRKAYPLIYCKNHASGERGQLDFSSGYWWTGENFKYNRQIHEELSKDLIQLDYCEIGARTDLHPPRRLTRLHLEKKIAILFK